MVMSLFAEVVGSELSAAEWSDGAPEWAQGIAALYRWGLNYETNSPFQKFLDLVGYSADEFGQNLARWDDASSNLGYVELGYLSDALGNWAERPHECELFVRSLLDLEARNGA